MQHGAWLRDSHHFYCHVGTCNNYEMHFPKVNRNFQVKALTPGDRLQLRYDSKNKTNLSELNNTMRVFRILNSDIIMQLQASIMLFNI